MPLLRHSIGSRSIGRHCSGGVTAYATAASQHRGSQHRTPLLPGESQHMPLLRRSIGGRSIGRHCSRGLQHGLDAGKLPIGIHQLQCRLQGEGRPCGAVRTVKVKSLSCHDCCAGHSLGGALAQLAAHDVQTEFKRAHPWLWVSCYTLGSPRVGNSAFADTFQKSGWECCTALRRVLQLGRLQVALHGKVMPPSAHVNFAKHGTCTNHAQPQPQCFQWGGIQVVTPRW